MDLKLAYLGYNQGTDLVMVDGDLVLDDGYETAAIISLFSDALAAEDEKLPGGTDRRGWWGDSYADVPDGETDSTGSKDWLFGRDKQLQEVVDAYRRSGINALAWLVTDEAATKVDVDAFILRPGVLARKIAIHLPNGEVQPLQFESPLKKGA